MTSTDGQEVECHKCGYLHRVDCCAKQSSYEWACSNCGSECGMTVSRPMEEYLSAEEVGEIRRKSETFGRLHILYSGPGDLPKFKKYNTEFASIGNAELIKTLRENNGITIKLSLLEAEHEKIRAEKVGLATDLMAISDLRKQ